ncbi:hypothetical protein ACF0H5_019830 [Mactra antiquata]
MATHFICQSTEPLPHNFPTGPSVKTHGAVSQYEVYNAARKAHTKFPAPGWDFSQTSEEDSLPLIHPAPEPESRSTSFVCDADLCVTPLKTPSSSARTTFSNDENIFRKPEVNPDPGLELTPMKNYDDDSAVTDQFEKGRKQKVRFDIDDSLAELNSNSSVANKKPTLTKTYKPQLYEDDECDIEIEKITNVSENVLGKKSDNSRTVKYTVTESGKFQNENTDAFFEPMKTKSQKDKTQSSKQAIPKTQIQKSVKVIREKTEQSQVPINLDSEKVDHIASCWEHESTGAKRKVKVCRDNQYKPGDTEYSYPFRENAVDEYAGSEEHMFARPEYNSTLKMKLEAQRLEGATVDLEAALKKKLQVSDSVKTEINEKVASLVNTTGPAFSGLISLNIPDDEICKQAAEQKTIRAKQVILPESKFQDFNEPDSMDFYSEDKQSVSYSLHKLSEPNEQLSTDSHKGVFDLYKHNRVWDKSRRY